MFRVAIIGCGNIAGGYDEKSKANDYWSHVKAYKANKTVSVDSVYDPDEITAARFIKRWEIKKAYNDLSLMLQETKPDIVSICSPNAVHYEQIRQCADAGVKTILCEKPLSLNVTEVQDAIAYCERKGVSLVVNYLRNWDKMFLALERELQAIGPGEVESVHVNFNKGVFHNASHFINFFLRSFGKVNNAQVIQKLPEGNDAYSDFVLSFDKCEKVYFFNHMNAEMLITEIELFFKHKRVKITGGGQQFITHSYKSGERRIVRGSIHQCMRKVINDVVAQTKNKQKSAEWEKNLANILEVTKICQKIVFD
jgi:predicted peroxiredoxin